MSMFKKAAIVGTGLIGGSIALDIRRLKLADEIVGVSRHKKSIAIAKKTGAIDRGSCDLKIISGCDLLILAVPISSILELSVKIAKIIPKDCLVTDVGSTKSVITRKLEKTFDNFAASHPLAGSEARGISHAKKGLFKHALCVVTPTRNTPAAALAKIKLLWHRLGAKVVVLSPGEHDRILSFASHLPHAVAFSLISAMPQKVLKFASGGLKDTTRIAASDPLLWLDIFLSNRANMLKAIGLFERQLSFLKEAIARGDKSRALKILSQAQSKRITLI